ncbi:hypothetical protein WR25_18738 [Diploscapter pachys]|uniref:Uncharacterized protein n=1 Tax=Diploscapter pachys TaxID=2018661 RepID=A0A2A2K3Z8_9BILA|nr:hypothetical protein WR25_18738 [Diploscapter pachys]
MEDGRAEEKQLGKGHRKSFNTALNAMRIRFARLQKGRKRKKSTRDAWMNERVGEWRGRKEREERKEEKEKKRSPFSLAKCGRKKKAKEREVADGMIPVWKGEGEIEKGKRSRQNG